MAKSTSVKVKRDATAKNVSASANKPTNAYKSSPAPRGKVRVQAT